MPGVRPGRRRAALALLLLACSACRLLLGGLPLLRRADLRRDDAVGEEILRRLCGDFAAGRAAGDMCGDLCARGLVEYIRCLNYGSGKTVMEVRWRGRPVVLKSKLENLSSYRSPGWPDYREDAAEDSPPPDVVLWAALKVRSDLGLAQDEEEEAASADKLRPWDKKTYSGGELTSLWSLLQQEEYTLLRVLQDLSAHVPKVLGSCGHFYAVEALSAGRAGDEKLWDPSRRQKVHRVALGFLDMVQHFDRDFTHKVHLCDVKPENFAVREDLSVVAIDLDMAFFQPKMAQILDRKCGGDGDCNFFDCVSRCDPGARRCRRRRANTNLQVICQKIFGLWFSPAPEDAQAGLPLQVELQRTVRECSLSAGADKGGQGPDVHRRLRRILTRLLREGREESRGGAGLSF